MQQQNQPAQNNKVLHRFLPRIVLGIGVLIVLAGVIAGKAGIIVSCAGSRSLSPIEVSPRHIPKVEVSPRHIPKVNLIIYSNVNGAEVYLNGQKTTAISHMSVLDLVPNTYQITLKKQGYADQTETVEVTGQINPQVMAINMYAIRMLRLGPPSPRESYESYGELLTDSISPGLKDKSPPSPAGQTDSISPGLKDKSPPSPAGQSVHIPKVNLIIYSNVNGAEVYLNGQKTMAVSRRFAPTRLLDLVPNTYQVTLKKQGYADQTETVEVTGQIDPQVMAINMQLGE